MKKRKFFKTAIALVMSVALISGCSSEGSSSSAEESGGEKVIKMWTREASAANVQEVVDKFNEEKHGFKIEVTSFPNHSFSDQFAAGLSSNDVPDILSLDLILAPYFSSIGALQDLTDKYESLSYKDQFIDAMDRLGTYEDKKYALPFSADVSALVYNKQHFKEAGLDPEKPPTTWQEMREYAKKLTTKDRYGYVFAGADLGAYAFTFLPFMWGNGGDVFNDDSTKSALKSKEALEALQYYTDLTRKDNVTPEGVVTYSWAQTQDAFTSGKASMILTGNFVINTLNKEYPDIDYGVTLIPKNEGKEHSSFAGGELIAIPNGSKYPEEAWEFIEYALSEEAQIDVFAKSGTIPIRTDLFDNQYFKEEPRYQVFAEALKVGNTPYTTKYTEIFSQPLLNAMQSALKGDVTPEEAFKKADKEINNILSN
ncbi:ABC transporter substrate-binding protein [Mesobacillus foraminis]|uniref:Multiple sugar transport system substrate-binding protein n=1 Tax=Mesobacillus foraminis TaxID=279826 RepID=A0A4R2B5P2_9BACI|nr:ABC transporter substrate-binding protein [Mesobacillus foraminis]TCN21162.1 multiple sugar transport system substrate-binding protein [Mesobacillus foraminis]